VLRWRPWVRRREVTVAVPAAAAQAWVTSALWSLPSIVTSEPGSDVIRAIRREWPDLGQQIMVWMFTERTGTRVLIESRPLIPTLYDWGVNRNTVDRVAAMIEGPSV
jgi:hypothetical protein